MKISIHTYGNMVSVDHESHAIGKPLEAMFPGVSAIHYDHETGIGHVEYLPTPAHTFYGMDGLKGLSDVLAAWNSEHEALEKLRAEAAAAAEFKFDSDLQHAKDHNAPVDDLVGVTLQHVELAASEAEHIARAEAAAEAARKADADARKKSQQRAPVVIEEI
jgi:hypothetical protein